MSRFVTAKICLSRFLKFMPWKSQYEIICVSATFLSKILVFSTVFLPKYYLLSYLICTTTFYFILISITILPKSGWAIAHSVHLPLTPLSAYGLCRWAYYYHLFCLISMPCFERKNKNLLLLLLCTKYVPLYFLGTNC